MREIAAARGHSELQARATTSYEHWVGAEGLSFRARDDAQRLGDVVKFPWETVADDSRSRAQRCSPSPRTAASSATTRSGTVRDGNGRGERRHARGRALRRRGSAARSARRRYDHALSWPDALCEALASGGRHVVRYDLRDYGASTTVSSKAPAYTLRDLAADAAALACELDDRPAHLTGIGVSGMVAQVAALDHPTAFSALTLVGTRQAELTPTCPTMTQQR